MAAQTLRIGLIYGSARSGRFCDTVAAWVRDRIEREPNLAVSVIDPRDASDDPRDAADDPRDPADARNRARIAEADAFVVVTPEYNHGYTPELKALIDGCNDEWHAKPVAFVSYGGVSGGLRAVEQLRLVFAELHATTVRDSVSFANASDAFDHHGQPLDAERAGRAMGRLTASLTWWAAVLRHGRRVAPYAQRAA
jgi:NAD(P)H-dependent FMN reductase